MEEWIFRALQQTKIFFRAQKIKSVEEMANLISRPFSNFWELGSGPFVWKTSAYEPQHDKTNKMSVRPAKTQISLGICPV